MSDAAAFRRTQALVALAKSEPLARSDFEAFAGLAAETSADILDVERVGIWAFNDRRSVLACVHLFQRTSGQRSSGLELQSDRYPRYFAALERGRTVAAHDARTDPDTVEFSEQYLGPLGITSMLDAPLRSEGAVIGVVCHEHVGPARTWSFEEQDFAASVADFISLVLEGQKRRQAEAAFRSAQAELLRQQWQATEQIESELQKVKDDLVLKTRLAVIGQVAASIAHDLRNPLGAIHNAVYYLGRHVPPDQPKWAEYLRIIGQEVHAADAILTSLLDMSRGAEPTKQEVDLGRLVEEAYGYVQDAGAIRLLFEADPRPFLLRADPDQLRQVLVNLLTNAAQAVEGQGSIRVEGRREQLLDRVFVRDDGRGVPPDLRDRIFEPLVTTKAKGTGLGLAICRQFVEAHGGTLELVDSPAGGATFCICLPRQSG